MLIKQCLIISGMAIAILVAPAACISSDVQLRYHQQHDYVILLHGLGRTANSMNRLEEVLNQQGFDVYNIGYPSKKYPLEKLTELVEQKIKKCCPDPNRKVHFVTHSMGGILVRSIFQQHTLANMGRVVMLAPPNQGSELTDHLKNNFVYQLLTGPAGQQLGTNPDSIPNKLNNKLDYEVGVITGNRSFNSYYSFVIPGEDDGKVSVKRAKLPGMRDFLVVPHTHTFIMNSRKVMAQVIHFIEEGRFER